MPAAAPARRLTGLDTHQRHHFHSDASLLVASDRRCSSTTMSETGALSESSAPRHLHLVPATTINGNSATPNALAAKSPTAKSPTAKSPTAKSPTENSAVENSAVENSAAQTPHTGTPKVSLAADQEDEGATLRGRHRRQPLLLRLMCDDSGLSTAEYAVATVAACAFAAVLFRILTGNEVVGLVTGLIRRGLDVIQ